MRLVEHCWNKTTRGFVVPFAYKKIRFKTVSYKRGLYLQRSQHIKLLTDKAAFTLPISSVVGYTVTEVSPALSSHGIGHTAHGFDAYEPTKASITQVEMLCIRLKY